jgi:hypothetical protein
MIKSPKIGKAIVSTSEFVEFLTKSAFDELTLKEKIYFTKLKI